MPSNARAAGHYRAEADMQCHAAQCSATRKNAEPIPPPSLLHLLVLLVPMLLLLRLLVLLVPWGDKFFGGVLGFSEVFGGFRRV